MSTKKVRWGILGTADIARKNWLAILNSGNGAVTAVASREQAKAQRFIDECQAIAAMPEKPRAFGAYPDLLADKDVEAVYIPLPTGLRKEWVLQAARAGKHIVCEKPCGPNLGDLQGMLQACKRHRVQFMDGVMFMHSARLAQLQGALNDLGRLQRITSAFTFRAPDEFLKHDIRVQPQLEPYGCLGDLGWYCIRFSLWAMGWQMPVQVGARILASSEVSHQGASAVTALSGELLFEGGASAGFFCSFLTHNQEWALVSGTQGYLRVEDFVLPFAGNTVGFEVSNHQFLKSGCEFKMQPEVRRLEVAEHSQAHPNAQESKLFREFADQLRSGTLNEAWPEFALKTQAVVEACLTAARQNKLLSITADGITFA
jgi:predicted dehydrogenase